ncbi:MAG: winged helix-turn-helix transcriptional regulator [Tissierellia bacterium]|nr:winged helix-turn-helix transcriptional regulator [Tissierellia bacterium]
MIFKNLISKYITPLISLEEIATKKVGGETVAQNVPRGSQLSTEQIEKFILKEIRADNKVTRREIANRLGVTEKTIGRSLKNMNNIKFAGCGKHGCWELEE